MCDYGAQLVPEHVAGYEKYKKKTCYRKYVDCHTNIWDEVTLHR